MTTLRDAVLYCSCGRENFYEPSKEGPAGVYAGSCWDCRGKLPLPYRVEVERTETTAMLNYDSALYPHHVDPNRRFDFSRPIGQVVVTHNRWGLKNLSSGRWVSRLPDHTMTNVDPGRTLGLESGVEVRFGTSVGTIVL
ncbi:hypothetical protein JXD38_05115 [candidate division WOR-3 bacterium]|nr:hypothetical protein [candidate division WOR-3 bacterium]